MKFIALPTTAQQQFIRVLSDKSGLDPQIIEKDWWVTAVDVKVLTTLHLLLKESVLYHRTQLLTNGARTMNQCVRL